MVYKGTKYVPIASLSKEISDITITCTSPSKPYNITGINHSYIIYENKALMEKYSESQEALPPVFILSHWTSR
jgi:cystathionine beta-lyase